VFDGDPQARAKDRDRDRAVYVVDAALRNGQITQQDRDLRVERARAAHTIGELETLTHDIASPPVPLPPTAAPPADSTVSVPLATDSVVVIEALAASTSLTDRPSCSD